MVETPRRPTNLGGVEDDLPGGLHLKKNAPKPPGREKKPFGGSAIFGAAPEKKANEQLLRREHQKTAGPASLTNQMMESLEGYLDNIAAAVTQKAANGGKITELTDSLAILVDTVARQQQ